MSAKRIDVSEHPAVKGIVGTGKHERLLFNSDTSHVWIHHSVPGDKGPMLCILGNQGRNLRELPLWSRRARDQGRR